MSSTFCPFIFGLFDGTLTVIVCVHWLALDATHVPHARHATDWTDFSMACVHCGRIFNLVSSVALAKRYTGSPPDSTLKALENH